jgi:hypothetical protein
MSYYLGLIVSVAAPALAAGALMVAVAAHDRRLVRRAIHLADRRIAILAPRKVRALDDALGIYLATPSGKAVAGDPLIAARVELLEGVRNAHDFARHLVRRRKALTHLHLAPNAS